VSSTSPTRTAPNGDSAADDASSDAASAHRPKHRRRRLSLQTRLMVTVIGIVALILVGVAFGTSALLGRILQQNLDNSVRESTNRTLIHIQQPSLDSGQGIATATLTNSPRQPGFLLLVQSDQSGTDAAYVDNDANVVSLTAAQRAQLISQVNQINQPTGTVSISGLGQYRVALGGWGGAVVIGGLPLSEVNQTIAQILTTVGLVTLAGLLLLAIAIAVIIRRGLAPLRAVADTATRVAGLPLSQGQVSITERVPAAQADANTEIGQVGAALNTLLDHVDESLEARQRNEERMRSFVADASHELRTPLASIRGYSELSLRDPSLSENTEQALERIQAQSLRMTGLVEDLLLLARLDEGKELVYGSVDLTRLAIEAVGDARPAGPDHTWMLDVGDEPVLIAGDEPRLHQVVANLLANARAHTPAGTEVTVTVTRDGDLAVLRVHDTGPGVDPAIADELFERFSRADTSRARRTGGTGLGLSIARAIVGAHHGTITVESVPGDTTFEVRLPARPVDPADRIAPAPVAEAEPEDADAEPADSGADVESEDQVEPANEPADSGADIEREDEVEPERASDTESGVDAQVRRQ
jgi:two-component system, OmpR family, sensor kinase